MVFQGPKSILSSAIATALGEYFVVDKNLIESNLLRDAKIVLRNVQLRKQVTSPVVQNSAGRPTIATVTGSVDEVAFTWAWSVGSSKNGSWVKDAALTIKGLRLCARLEHGTGEEELTVHPNLEAQGNKLESTAEVRKEGGMKAFVRKQVEMIVDSLTLNVLDFEFTVEMPPPLTDSGKAPEKFAIVLGGQKVELLSFGWSDTTKKGNTTEETDKEKSNSVLKECLTVGSFYISLVAKSEGKEDDVVESATDKDTVLPLMEPFSYSVEATRMAGKRFSEMSRGLEVVGRSIEKETGYATAKEDGLVLHAGSVQIRALTQLGVLLLAPPNEGDDEKISDNTETSDQTEEPQLSELPDGIDSANEEKEISASTFVFSVSSVSLVGEEDTTMTVPMLMLTYRADGTMMNMKASGFLLKSPVLGCEVSEMKASMRPNIVLELSVVETLFVPEVVELTSPIYNPRITYEGKTLSICLETVEATLLGPRNVENKVSTSKSTVQRESARKSASKNNSSRKKEGNDDVTTSTPRMSVPFPMNLSVQNIRLKKEVGRSLMQLQELDLSLNPKSEADVGTQVALRLARFQNELLLVNKANVYAFLPLEQPDEVQAFNFSAESARVSGGHSTHEWSDKFEPEPTNQTTKSRELPKFPFAKVAALKLTVAWEGKGMAVKDTSLFVKPFQGKASTTGKDLIMYYTQACLGRFPGFISNAEVLGLNVVDTSASTYGAFLGMPFMGAGGGLAAIAAVDGVKGAVAAGKRSRKVDVGEGWKPGDFIRGVVYSSQEATSAGAIKRGKQSGHGNVTDFAVGLTSATGEYVGENKSRLGAAGAGGVGMVVGTMFGGPVGGIVGGVLASAVTGKTIDHVQDRTTKMSPLKAEEADEKDRFQTMDSLEAEKVPTGKNSSLQKPERDDTPDRNQLQES